MKADAQTCKKLGLQKGLGEGEEEREIYLWTYESSAVHHALRQRWEHIWWNEVLGEYHGEVIEERQHEHLEEVHKHKQLEVVVPSGSATSWRSPRRRRVPVGWRPGRHKASDDDGDDDDDDGGGDADRGGVLEPLPSNRLSLWKPV